MSLTYFPVLSLTLGLASARPQVSEVKSGSGSQWLPPVQSGLPPNFPDYGAPDRSNDISEVSFPGSSSYQPSYQGIQEVSYPGASSNQGSSVVGRSSLYLPTIDSNTGYNPGNLGSGSGYNPGYPSISSLPASLYPSPGPSYSPPSSSFPRPCGSSSRRCPLTQTRRPCSSQILRRLTPSCGSSTSLGSRRHIARPWRPLPATQTQGSFSSWPMTYGSGSSLSWGSTSQASSIPLPSVGASTSSSGCGTGGCGK